MKRNLLLVLGSLVLALLLAESVLRLLDYSYHTGYIADNCCGAALLPGAEGWQRNEGAAYIKINSRGLRDWEHTLIKPPGVIRIAVLGDSFTEAAQVPLEQAFWQVMKKQLAQCSSLNDKTIEVINFGVSGYGTAQELQTLRHKVWQYHPDIVLLAFLSGNDIVNNSRSLEIDKIRPFFVLNNGELILDESFLNDPAYLLQTSVKADIRNFLVKYSRLFQLRAELRSKLQVRSLQEQDTTDNNFHELGLNDRVYQEPTDKIWADAWKVTERLIKQINDEVHDQNAEFLLVTLSNSIQVNSHIEGRQRYAQAIGVADLGYPDRRILNYAKQHNIQVLSLMPYLRDWVDNNKICVHGFENNALCTGHWNAQGHNLSGELIAEKLCRDFL